MSNYLVTGGAGFIGSHIVTELVRRGDTVRVLDNFSTGNVDKLAHVKDSVEVIQGDLRSIDDVDRAVRGVDYVLHQGALPSVPRSIDDPITSNEVNVKGTLQILWAAHRFNVKRVVVASSSSVYGDTPTLPKVETMFQAPRSPYAVSKMATEQYAIGFWHSYGLETIALRYFNVFGERQDPDSQYSAVIPKFLSIMREGNRPVIYGDGEQSRDFTHVDNVVQANLLSCIAEGAPGEAFNCACNERVSLNDLVRMLNELLGTDIPAEYADDRAGDVKHSLADISKAERLLGYRIVTPFEEGLKRLVEQVSV
jgi:nucleoside-diphosphate-sugar epimerase